MAIVKRIQLGSSVRRVQPPKPVPGVDPVVAYEHLYHELIFVREGEPDNGLPPVQPGLPEVGVPGFPDNALPGDQPGIDNDLPRPGFGWAGCSGGSVDNTLPTPPPLVDNSLPDGGSIDNSLPGAPPVVNPPLPDQGLPGGPPPIADNDLPPGHTPKQ